MLCFMFDINYCLLISDTSCCSAMLLKIQQKCQDFCSNFFNMSQNQFQLRFYQWIVDIGVLTSSSTKNRYLGDATLSCFPILKYSNEYFQNATKAYSSCLIFSILQDPIFKIHCFIADSQRNVDSS